MEQGKTRCTARLQKAKPFHRARGWKSKNLIHSRRGRKMFLTSPLIDQALALIEGF